jgi:hypothetical protein
MKYHLSTLFIWVIFCLIFITENAFSLEKNSNLYSISPLITKKLITAPAVDAARTKCLSDLPASTRKFLFDFYYSSALVDPTIARNGLKKFSKICGMIYKESSGNPVSCTDMHYNGSRTSVVEFCKNDSLASVSMYNKLRDDKSISRNYQTNFGLLQLSADILTWNTSLRSIFEHVVEEVSSHPDSALSMCGSKCMFSNCGDDLLDQMKKFSHCKLNYRKKVDSKKGETIPDITADEINCFDHWVSFCPNLNLALGMQLSDSYFESRKAPALCEDELSLILTSVMLKKNNEKLPINKCKDYEK